MTEYSIFALEHFLRAESLIEEMERRTKDKTQDRLDWANFYLTGLRGRVPWPERLEGLFESYRSLRSNL